MTADTRPRMDSSPFAAPSTVDGSAFRDSSGGYTTSRDQIVSATVDSYGAPTPTPDHATRLAEASTPKVPS